LALGPVAAAQSGAAAVPAQMQPDVSFGYALNNEGAIRQIIVYRNNHQIQALDSCTGQDVPREKGLGELTREDFNFDGYQDLMMLVAFDAQTRNSSYCIWLYDPNTQTFVFSEELSQLTNPRPNPNNRTVVARKNMMCSEQCYVQETYEWSGVHLKPVREESLAEDPTVPTVSTCRYVRTIKTDENGKLAETSRERVNTGGVMCEPHAVW